MTIPLPEPDAWRSQSPVGGYHFSETRPTGAVEKYPQTPLVTLEDAIAYGAACAAEQRERCATALRIAREGYASEAATGLPVLPKWRERAITLIDAAIRASSMPESEQG